VNRNLGRSLAAIAGAVVLTSSGPVSAQIWEKLTNPKFSVPIEHPPQVVMKGVTKVALRNLEGLCGDEIADNITQVLFENRRFEVIERSNVEAALQEQQFQAAGAVSQSSAVKLGQMLGPAALVIGKVNRCSVEDSGPLRQNYQTTERGVRVVKTKFSRRTTAHVSAAIRIVDLTTGRVVASQTFDERVPLTNESWEGVPEPPDPNMARSQVYRRVTEEFMKLISPWKETVQLTVYDDDKWGLKTSMQQMKRGDFEGAAKTVKDALSQAPANPKEEEKMLPKAKYNLGIALMYSGHPLEALESLQQSATLKNSDIANEAIAAARQMLALQARAKAAQANALDLEGSAAAVKAATAQAAEQEMLRNTDIIEMAKAKLGDAIIVAKIKGTPCKFDTSAKGLTELKTAGVSDQVILAMTEAAARKGTI
jgi:curli biogenesis system outer membrane secretion channel CsgG